MANEFVEGNMVEVDGAKVGRFAFEPIIGELVMYDNNSKRWQVKLPMYQPDPNVAREYYTLMVPIDALTHVHNGGGGRVRKRRSKKRRSKKRRSKKRRSTKRRSKKR
jgi:hypothetical protein